MFTCGHLKRISIDLISKNLWGHLGGSVGEASNFGSGRHLRVPEFKPCIGFHDDNAEPAWDSFSFPLSLCHIPEYTSVCILSLKINK